MTERSTVALLLLLAIASRAAAQDALPPLPDSTGFGVHVLTAARDSSGAVWVGTYGRGIYRWTPGAATWQSIRHDSTATSLSWDFVHAIAFGPRGQVWYGTVGNGWGLSTDGGRTWRNWTFDQLGPEWQYVTPGGIVTRGDTTVIATADGFQITTDDGAHWFAIGDSIGRRAKGPADSARALLANEYVTALAAAPTGWSFRTLRGAGLLHADSAWSVTNLRRAGPTPPDRVLVGDRMYLATPCGLQPAEAVSPCFPTDAPAAAPPRALRTTWFRRPIVAPDSRFIDQTYRYGSTMGGNFQQHQGVEFNNPDGTDVHAIGSGEVVYAGRAERGALTIAIRHGRSFVSDGRRHDVYSVYYHNSAIGVAVGDKVQVGQVIALVGNTGRATNDHLHLEVHASPVDSVGAIVDSLQRFPPYTTNPELWIDPLPGTGVVAGQVFDSAGRPVRQARVYGLRKPAPRETPFSFAETYGERAHPHPLYGEHFAVGDVPAGTYTLVVEIGGQLVYRRVRVAPRRVTWVEFRP